MVPLKLIFLVLAFVCLLLAAFGVNAPRVQLGWLGLAFYVLVVLMGAET